MTDQTLSTIALNRALLERQGLLMAPEAESRAVSFGGLTQP